MYSLENPRDVLPCVVMVLHWDSQRLFCQIYPKIIYLAYHVEAIDVDGPRSVELYPNRWVYARPFDISCCCMLCTVGTAGTVRPDTFEV